MYCVHYDVIFGTEIVAKNLRRDIALILIKALLDEYYNDMNLGNTISLRVSENSIPTMEGPNI